MNATLGQEMDMELWDYDPGFPGVQNDDFLGRCGGRGCVAIRFVTAFGCPNNCPSLYKN